MQQHQHGESVLSNAHDLESADPADKKSQRHATTTATLVESSSSSADVLQQTLCKAEHDRVASGGTWKSSSELCSTTLQIWKPCLPSNSSQWPAEQQLADGAAAAAAAARYMRGEHWQ